MPPARWPITIGRALALAEVTRGIIRVAATGDR